MSSQVTVGGASRSASQPAAASAMTTTATGPSSQAGVVVNSSRPSRRRTRRSSLFSWFSRGSYRVSRADCIRLAVVGLLLAGVVAAIPTGGQEPASPIGPINGLREHDELAPVAASTALDEVARRYLETMLAARCLCPVEDGEAGSDRLLADVRSALGGDAALVDAGLVVGYDHPLDAAMRTTIFDPANSAAILGARMTLVGIATGVVGSGESWLAPPPGRLGPEIELAGYTLVVIVMAGSGA
jgi:hypothetical protein